MIRGITFAEQLITSDDFSHFMHTFLNKANGVTKGCEISAADTNIYIQKGYFIQFGRMVQIVGTETIETPEVQSGTLYCRLVFEIDLSKNNTAESFSQGYFKTLSSASGYPEVTQQDLDSGGTIYQVTWATYVKGVEGISNFRDVRPILNLEAVWNAVSSQNASYKTEFDEYFALQKSVIEQMIMDLQDAGFASQESVNTLSAEVAETKKSVSDGKTLLAAAITAKRVAAAASDTFAVLAEKIGQIVLGSGNAAAGDVLKGKTFTNDDGVEYTGTLEDKSGTTQSATASIDTANSRLQMTIPATGKYSTASKIYAAYSAIRSLIGLTADKIWYNETILGLKSSRSGIVAKTYTPGTANQVIAAGTCNVGAQTIKGDANLVAANIKKGVKIFGVTGTWEGYIATNELIYNQGAEKVTFSAGVSSSNAAAPQARKDETCVTIYVGDNGSSSSGSIIYSYAGMVSKNPVSLSNIKTIRVTFNGTRIYTKPASNYIYVGVHSTDGGYSNCEKRKRLDQYTDGVYAWEIDKDFTLDLDVSGVTGSVYIKAGYYCGEMIHAGELMHIKKIQLLS